MSKLSSETELSIDHYLDTQGLICPEPVMLLHKSIRHADGGELIEVLATDPATTRDIPNFCRHLGHKLLLQQTLEENIKHIEDESSHTSTDNSADINDTSIDDKNIAGADNISRYRYVIQKKQA